MIKIKIIGLFLFPVLLNAQDFSRKGRFAVDFNKGCSPLTVNISEFDAFGTVTRTYFYSVGSSSTNAATFTYNVPGTYQIVQVVGVDNIEDKTDTLEIQVFESLKPSIEVTRCNNFEVFIQSTDTYYDAIRVYFTTADSVTLNTDESSSFAFGSENIQTIRLKGLFSNADEVCNVFLEEFKPVSQTIPSEITDASIKESCQNVYDLYLTINAFDSLTNYRVKLNQSSESMLYDGFVDTVSIVIRDIPFETDDFCLSVESFDPCAGDTRSGRAFCGSPTTLSLSPFESLYSTYNESGIYINLDNVSSGSFAIQRRFEGGNFENRTIVNGSFEDPVGSISRKYFYKIDYIDNCGSTLFNAETHPPHLDAVPVADNQYQITFSPSQNSLGSSENDIYQIGKTTEPVSNSTFDLILSSDDGIPRQFLTAQSTYATDEILRSNTLTLAYEFVVYVPAAFTPNEDGLNDTLDFYGLPAGNAKINIYSKWGQILYSSVDVEDGWDGIISGSVAPEGTYLYEIVFETTDGNLLKQKGTFVLINK
ncbi:MAG: gliding motility-associated C-terminal domain-containing protein [Ekhidna sp.]|nr:gliding motility-associated C-terminal domain-containing protein [Ekhidna sp.]